MLVALSSKLKTSYDSYIEINKYMEYNVKEYL